MRALPPVARKVSSNPDSYVYLAESIRAWPDQRALAEQVRAAGWDQVAWRNLSGGIVALHRAIRGEPHPGLRRASLNTREGAAYTRGVFVNGFTSGRGIADAGVAAHPLAQMPGHRVAKATLPLGWPRTRPWVRRRAPIRERGVDIR